MNKLKKYREEQQLSQAELARKALVNQVIISEVENDRRVPYPAFKRRIAKVLGKSEKQIFGEQK